MNIYLVSLVFVFFKIQLVNSLAYSLEEIISNYDATARPRVGRGAVMVNVSFLINSLEIDDTRQMLKVSGEIQQEWDDISLRSSRSASEQNFVGLQAYYFRKDNDSRARGNRIKERLWLPDVTLAAGQNSNVPPGGDFLLIDTDGHMTWIQQVTYEFPCKFDFSYYPVGKHSCKLKLQSVGYDAKEMEPRWAGESSVYYSNAIVSLRYAITGVDISTATVVNIRRTKNQLQATLKLKNVSGWAIKHTVLPFVATVTTAYLAFFLNIRGITARVIVCCVSFMIACVVHESTYINVPQVPYTMAIEIFTGTCLTFIWLALIETVVVDVLSHLPKRPSHTSSHNSFTTEHSEMMELGGATRGQIAALWLDRCFRVLYPATFLAFNAVYWILYH